MISITTSQIHVVEFHLQQCIIETIPALLKQEKIRELRFSKAPSRFHLDSNILAVTLSEEGKPLFKTDEYPDEFKDAVYLRLGYEDHVWTLTAVETCLLRKNRKELKEAGVIVMETLPNSQKEAAKTNDALPGVFTVNHKGKKVRFSRGNLFWDGRKFDMEKHQYDYPTTRNADHIGHFFYSKDAAVARAALCNDPSATDTDVLFAANGEAIEGWTVLTGDEWQYLIDHSMTRKEVIIAGIACTVLVPDGYAESVASSYTASEWKAAENDGLVAIPHAGAYDGSFYLAGSHAGCWSSTPYAGFPDRAWYAFFNSGATSTYNYGRRGGFSVRLVSVQ